MTLTAPVAPRTSDRWPMRLPEPRGDVSAMVIERLRDDVGGRLEPGTASDAVRRSTSLLDDEDLQLALFLLYELHYGGIEGVDDRLEWDPEVLAFRGELERAFEAELRERIPQPHATRDVTEALFALVETADDGPGLSAWVERDATVDQVREVLVHLSLIHI